MAGRRLRKSVRKMLGKATIYVVLVVLALIFTTPLIWMVSTSLKTDPELAAWPPIWIPAVPQWQNYVDAWGMGQFGVFVQNTVGYAVLGTLGQILSASMVAFGFARLRFPGREKLFGLVLATMMLPGVVTLIPSFVLFRILKWLDSYKPLIVPAFFGGGAFFIFLLRQFFLTIPGELFEAAKIDGASNYRIFGQIMLPLSKPALSTVAIYGFMSRWNDFMGPLIYLRTESKFPVSLGIRRFVGGYGMGQTAFQEMMAMSFLMTLPVIVVFFSFQQYFVQGIVMTGIKA